MKCPVCKTECSGYVRCPKCGFDQLQIEFLSEADAISWMNNVVLPYRKKLNLSNSTTPAESLNSEEYSLQEKSNLDFQNILQQNLRSPEAVMCENTETTNNLIRKKAENTIQEIKKTLLQKAQNAEYTMENGCTSLTCFYQLPHFFMRSRREDNIEQIKQNQKNFVLFRDPNLIYMTWNIYEINPKHSSEYFQYITSVKNLAVKENISIECVVYNGRDKKHIPFPSKVRNDYSTGWALCIKATTILSSETNNIPAPQHLQNSANNQYLNHEKQQNLQIEKTQNKNGATIIKSLLTIGLVVGAFALCLTGEIGKFGMGLILICAAIGGYFLLKKQQ